jgi:glycosyltransferase involved in cell wall biosynthesis
MKLSVVIPTYNEERDLPRLLTALANQTIHDFEVIVADNKSTDSTREIATKFGARVVDGGNPSEGRNAGARAATGDTILFFDADVFPPADFIENALKEFQEKNLDCASADSVPISNHMRDKALHEVVNKYFRLVEDFFPHAPGFFIIVKKEIFEKVGGFDPEVKFAEDHVFVHEASKFGKFLMLRSVRIPVSARRISKEGRFLLSVKYLGAELHLIFKGPIKSDIFKYRFGHSNTLKKE